MEDDDVGLVIDTEGNPVWTAGINTTDHGTTEPGELLPAKPRGFESFPPFVDTNTPGPGSGTTSISETGKKDPTSGTSNVRSCFLPPAPIDKRYTSRAKACFLSQGRDNDSLRPLHPSARLENYTELPAIKAHYTETKEALKARGLLEDAPRGRQAAGNNQSRARASIGRSRSQRSASIALKREILTSARD